MRDLRVAALARFSIAITVLTVLGHVWLGFEPAYGSIAVALATAYGAEIFFESIQAFADKRRPAYRGEGFIGLVKFLLPAHITGLACAMLLYTNTRMWPLAFACAAGIGSKWIFRAKFNGRSKHFLNPSNTGIAVAMLIYPWVSTTPPYQFTENVSGPVDWIIPMVIICTGSFLNARFTRRIPLILGWAGAFVAQAVVRMVVFNLPSPAPLALITGVAFLLFTFYMLSDPGTTPSEKWPQVIFGASVAVLYGVLVSFHLTYGMFYALLIVCSVRGAYAFATDALKQRVRVQVPVSAGARVENMSTVAVAREGVAGV